MYRIFLVLLCIKMGVVKAQQFDVQAYIVQYAQLAIEEQWRTGIPASIKLAQGIHESGAGSGNLATRSHNHFGIKCKTTWAGPTVYHDDDEKGECFRAYGSVQDSYRDHSDFLVKNQRYASLFKLDVNDYKGWANGLKQAGYATNPKYPVLIIKLIEEYSLHRFTQWAIERTDDREAWALQIAAPTVSEPKVVTQKPASEPKAPVVAVAEKVVTPQASPVVSATITATHQQLPEGVFSINQAKAIVAKRGTSLLAIAAEHQLSLRELMAINDLPKQQILAEDRLLFLEKRKKRFISSTHTVLQGETWWLIAQAYDLPTDKLLQLNGFETETILSPGQKLQVSLNDLPVSKSK